MKLESAGCRASRARALATSSLCCLGLLTITIAGAQGVARAATSSPQAPGPLFGVHPEQQGSTTLPGGHFNFALVPGARIVDGVVVENFSNRALRFHVYAADLVPATGGGLAPAQPTATMRAAGAWIVVAIPMVTIPARGQFTDKFTLTLPKLVSPGQHLGAVVAAAEVGITSQGNPIEARTALIAVVTVPGTARTSATLTPLRGSETQPGSMGFGTTLSNTGNVLLTYSGSLTIEDAAGHHVATLPLTPANAYVVPRGRVELAAVWEEPAGLSGTYRAQATVSILANGIPVRRLTSQSLGLQFSSGILTPLLIGGGLAFALLALLLLARWLVRGARRRRSTLVARHTLGTRRTGSQ